MKQCLYCGNLLQEGDRYCLHCMRRLSEPLTLPSYKIHRVPYSIVAAALAVFLAAGVFLAFSLSAWPVSKGIASGDVDDEGAQEKAGGGFCTDFSAVSKEESPLGLGIFWEGKEPSSEIPFSSGEESTLSSQESESSSHSQSSHSSQSSQGSTSHGGTEEEALLTAEAFFEKMAQLEEAELKTKLPGAARTREDLGPYSVSDVLEGEYEAVSSQDFESVYKAIPDYRMDLVENTRNTFQGLSSSGFGTSGKYSWKLLEAKTITNSAGVKCYAIRVEIQTQVDDPAVTQYGINTLEVVKQVRSHLTQNGGQRVNALPQQHEGHILVERLDSKGELSGSVKNQQEMIQSLCEEMDRIIAEYGYTQCRFDFRLASVEPIDPGSDRLDFGQFVFSYYLKPA